MVSKTENIEKGKDYAVSEDINRPVMYKDTPVDMIDVGKELNITLNDLDTKVNPGDPDWKKKEKL